MSIVNEVKPSGPSIPVTIVICTYNDAEYLPRALVSALEQNVDEIILLDDCSACEMGEGVWESIRRSGIVYVRHGKNAGLSAARNTGFSLARNEYVYPLDADDWLYPSAVKALYDAAVRDPYAIVACGDITEGKVRHYPPMKQRIDATTKRCKATKADWSQSNQMFAGSLIWKPAWRAVGGYLVLPHAHYEDYRLWNTMIKYYGDSSGFKYVDALIYEHTPRPDSMLKQLHSRTTEFHAFATEPLR